MRGSFTSFYTFRLEQHRCHFTDNIFKLILLNEEVCFVIHTALICVLIVQLTMIINDSFNSLTSNRQQAIIRIVYYKVLWRYLASQGHFGYPHEIVARVCINVFFGKMIQYEIIFFSIRKSQYNTNIKQFKLDLGKETGWMVYCKMLPTRGLTAYENPHACKNLETLLLGFVIHGRSDICLHICFALINKYVCKCYS